MLHSSLMEGSCVMAQQSSSWCCARHLFHVTKAEKGSVSQKLNFRASHAVQQHPDPSFTYNRFRGDDANV